MSNDEQAIRNLVTTWLDATAAGDIPKVLRLMAEDGSLSDCRPATDARERSLRRSIAGGVVSFPY